MPNRKRHLTSPSSAPQPTIKRVAQVAAAFAVALLAACGDDTGASTVDVSAAKDPERMVAEAIAARRPFFEIPRPGVFVADAGVAPLPGLATDAGVAAPLSEGAGFFLALRKSALTERYFYSVYGRSLFTGSAGRPVSNDRGTSIALGTRVVTFRVSSDRLFMIDADNRRVQSAEVFPDTGIVDAFPLVPPTNPWAQAPGAQDYVVIDPAQGQNRFGVDDETSLSGIDTRFAVDAAMVRRFRTLDDGFTFDKTFVGYFETPTPTAPARVGRAQGSVGVALRKYVESPGFVSKRPTAVPAFLLGLPIWIPNQARTEAPVLRWPITRGMKPIRWLISRGVDVVGADPRLTKQGVDVFAAIKEGVEAWNDVFGFPVFVAARAGTDDFASDDDKNLIVVNPNPRLGLAYADVRPNPNTGEIRGASVVLHSGWIEAALRAFSSESVATEPSASSALGREGDLAIVSAGDLHARALCRYEPSDLQAVELPTGTAVRDIKDLSPKQQIERFIAHVVAHEIGHTLGLRHNFKGSLEPPSSSIMDYLDEAHAVAAHRPGAYDKQAIAVLYDLGGEAITAPFCTDTGVAIDPTCDRYDATSDPLTQHHLVRYRGFLDRYLEAGASRDLDQASTAMGNILRFARYMEGTAAVRLEAWRKLVEPIRVPVAPARLAASRSLGGRVDNAARRMWGLVAPEPLVSTTGLLAPPPRFPADSALLTEIAGQARDTVLDLDGVRTPTLRRIAIDALKRLQTVEAYRALREARLRLAAQKAPPATGAPTDPAAPSEPELILEDLLARMDRALSPYFDR